MDLLVLFILIVLPATFVMLVVYFYLVRPMQKQFKKENEVRRDLRIGDRVLTKHGLVAEVVKRDGEKVYLLSGRKDQQPTELTLDIRELIEILPPSHKSIEGS